MSKAVFCIADHEFQADGLVTELKHAGFPGEAIAVLFPEHFHTTTRPEPGKSSEGETGGVAVGGIGSGLAWLPGAGTVTVPGAGSFIAAGPALAVLQRAPAGELKGALARIGIPQEFVSEFLAGIRSEQRILIGVYAKDTEGVERAKSAFQESHARNIVVAESAANFDCGVNPKRSYA
jgi:hypothetical protein